MATAAAKTEQQPTREASARTPLGAPTPASSLPAVIRAGFRPPPQTRLFTGLDIGTTKICAIIGEIEPNGRTTVRGLASTPSQGLRQAVVVDLDETVASIQTAVRKAEEIAQVAVRDVLVGIAGGHIQCAASSASVKVGNPERGVTRADIRRAIDRATAHQAPMEREVIHTLPQRFLIDDGPVANPEGFSSRTLGVEVLSVTAAVTSAQNIIRAVRQAHLRVAGIYLEPLASSVAILTPEDRDLGCLLIDIGGGTSDIAIWNGGSVRYTGVVRYGGDAVTEDIRRGLKISCYDAENLKKRHGTCLLDGIPEEETVEAPLALTGEPTKFSRRFLCEIIESRLSEILHMVKDQVEGTPAYEKAFGGVVLTGGGALQAGAEKLASEIFERPCKIGRPAGLSGLAGIAGSPIYSTGVGLLLYGLQHEQEILAPGSSMFHRLVRFFRRAIDWY